MGHWISRLACDVRVASIDAIIAHPVPGSESLLAGEARKDFPRIIQKGRALELFLTGRQITIG